MLTDLAVGQFDKSANGDRVPVSEEDLRVVFGHVFAWAQRLLPKTTPEVFND